MRHGVYISLCIASVSGAALLGTVRGQVPVRVEELIFVTEDRIPIGSGAEAYGCDGITVFRLGSSVPLYRSRGYVSPHRLAVAPDLSAVVASGGAREPFLMLLKRDSSDYSVWSSWIAKGADFVELGGLAVLTDSMTLLVPTSRWIVSTGKVFPVPVGPYYVRKYVMPHRVQYPGYSRMGLPLASIEIRGRPAEILLGADGHIAHVVTVDARVYTIDTETMTEVAAAIQMQPIVGLHGNYYGVDDPVPHVHAVLSGDGRYLITNRCQVPELNVADLVSRRAWTLPVSSDLQFTGGLAANRGWINRDLLAVHARDQIVIYRFAPEGPLEEIARAPVEAHVISQYYIGGPSMSIAWSGSGSHIIAATNHDSAEFVVMEVSDSGTKLSAPTYLTACLGLRNYPNDIVTANGLIKPPATTTPTIGPSPTSTSPSTAVSPTVTGTATSAPSITAAISPSPTSTLTRASVPVHLPVVLRERCLPGFQHTDVVLVIDASTSMRDELTSSGRSKLEAARDAAVLFIGQLDLVGGDHAAIVQFNADAALLSPLTRDRAALERALSAVQVARQTRIHAGIHLAREELTSARHRAVNNRAMVVLSDGANNPEPVADAEREAARARSDGIRVFTIGLGVEVESAALQRMASSPADYFYAPDGEDLAAIYRRIAYAIPCPPEAFWGGR